MRILIIAEPRTGGTTLMDWLSLELTGYTSITEPYTDTSRKWTDSDDITDVVWFTKFNNAFLKEIFEYRFDFTNLINASDKVICIYRNNWYEQVRSILWGEHVNEFLHSYSIDEVNETIREDKILERYHLYNKKLKATFQDFISKNNFVNVSYEDLYYGEGINIIKEYLGIESTESFPPIKRYLKDKDGNPFNPEIKKNKLL
jgi:hypothetical protein